MTNRRAPEDAPLNAAMRARIDRSHDTSRTPAPLETVSIRKPHGGFWVWICVAVFVVCVLATLVLIFG
ncbi:MAG TPA: hypothetical protein VNS22_16655 [Geminicoccus sp.]|uniref:hypothetical protein n=1 Tax=Geminicoccus sp. TaxID=2024832 RepID=UPI002C6486FB|nr:hypothetical protein [Geminicoccus sp.]HWL69997.1 hypothetical protein [Geminicoccus sp.]